MKIRKIVMFMLLCIATTAFGNEAQNKKKLSKEEVAERRELMRARRYARTGGIVTKRDGNLRVLALINVENVVDQEVLNLVAQEMQKGLLFSIVATNERPANAGLVIEIKDSDYPASMITAPENGYGMLNVRTLKMDSPSKEKLNRRLTQQIWRTTILTLGGGYDIEPRCLMKPFATVQELDACSSTCACPMSYTAAVSGAARFGVKPPIRMTYKQACEEGWAPPPTNAVQQAIWDKVRATPKTPMKIEFNPKKGR